MRQSLIWIAFLALAAAQAWAGGVPAPAASGAAKPEAAETKENAETVEPIPDDIQLIPALNLQAKETLASWARGLAVWPSADEISRKKATEDRSKKFPDRYSPGEDYSTDKPDRAGAVAPEWALKESEGWIRAVLKADWVPRDLAARLNALAEEDPGRSAVWCRYRIKGQAIQIGQMRGVMGVVIKPGEPKSEGETALDFGRRCLKEFLAKGKGQELAQRPMKAVPLTAPELSMFTGYFQTHDGNRTWGGPVAWYTDGRAVAVFLRKEGQISFGPDTPWF